MNALELSDDLEGAKLVILRLNDMLRQQQADFKKMQVSNQSWEIIAKGYGKTIDEQQAEIEALKAAKIRAYNNGVEDGRKPDTNNKPVAWMDEINTFVLDKDYQQFPKSLQNGMIPLYTHPVKELNRELLDKTIIDQQNEIKVLREQLRWALIAKEDVGHNFNVVSLQLQQKAQEKPASKCGDSYDTVCPPSICDCHGKAQEK